MSGIEINIHAGSVPVAHLDAAKGRQHVRRKPPFKIDLIVLGGKIRRAFTGLERLQLLGKEGVVLLTGRRRTVSSIAVAGAGMLSSTPWMTSGCHQTVSPGSTTGIGT